MGILGVGTTTWDLSSAGGSGWIPLFVTDWRGICRHLCTCWQYIFDVSVSMVHFGWTGWRRRVSLLGSFILFLKLIWFGHQYYIVRLRCWIRVTSFPWMELGVLRAFACPRKSVSLEGMRINRFQRVNWLIAHVRNNFCSAGTDAQNHGGYARSWSDRRTPWSSDQWNGRPWSSDRSWPLFEHPRVWSIMCLLGMKYLFNMDYEYLRSRENKNRKSLSHPPPTRAQNKLWCRSTKKRQQTWD